MFQKMLLSEDLINLKWHRYIMKFKEWLSLKEGWMSKGKAQDSLYKPGPKSIAPKPHDLKLCGIGGGPGPGGACASKGVAVPVTQ